ncbi:chain-length determining protein [Limosilactobacillus ingluviei]
MKEYQLKDVKASFVKAAVFTVIMALLGGAGMFVVAKHKQHISYTAERFVVISHPITTQTATSASPITNTDQQMMLTYEEIANDPMVAKAARKHLTKSQRKEYSADQISQDLDAKAKPQSLALRLKVTTNSPKNAAALVNAAAEGLKETLPKIQPGAGNVKLLAKATEDNVELNKSTNVKKYAAAGLALGGLVGIVISFVVITWRRVLK